MIVAGFVVLLAAALAVFAGDARLGAGLACCVAAFALWRAAALQERERQRRSRPGDAATVLRALSEWLVRRRREPIVSEQAQERGREYATGVQDGAYAVLDDVIDRVAEAMRMLPPDRRPRGADRTAGTAGGPGGQRPGLPPAPGTGRGAPGGTGQRARSRAEIDSLGGRHRREEPPGTTAAGQPGQPRAVPPPPDRGSLPPRSQASDSPPRGTRSPEPRSTERRPRAPGTGQPGQRPITSPGQAPPGSRPLPEAYPPPTRPPGPPGRVPPDAPDRSQTGGPAGDAEPEERPYRPERPAEPTDRLPDPGIAPRQAAQSGQSGDITVPRRAAGPAEGAPRRATGPAEVAVRRRAAGPRESAAAPRAAGPAEPAPAGPRSGLASTIHIR